MRRLLVAVLFLSAAVASAQSTNNTITPWRVTLFTSDVGVTTSANAGSDVSGGLGLGLAYAPNERWSAEFSVAAQRYNAWHTELRTLDPSDGGVRLVSPFITRREFNSFPITATGRYHFNNRSRWTPFLLAGLRHVQAPQQGDTITTAGGFPGVVTVTSGFFLEDRTSGEAGGGVLVDLTNRLGLQLEGRHLLRTDGAPHDPLMKVSVGLSWRF